jgi:hypothetical protein
MAVLLRPMLKDESRFQFVPHVNSLVVVLVSEFTALCTAHLKGFKRIIVHERCSRVAQEFRLYKYKVDPRTEDVLPVIIDQHNHGIDALRYALDGFIQQRGGAEMWARYGKHLQ